MIDQIVKRHQSPETFSKSDLISLDLKKCPLLNSNQLFELRLILLMQHGLWILRHGAKLHDFLEEPQKCSMVYFPVTESL